MLTASVHLGHHTSSVWAEQTKAAESTELGESEALQNCKNADLLNSAPGTVDQLGLRTWISGVRTRDAASMRPRNVLGLGA